MNRLLLIMTLLVLAGCMPAMNTPLRSVIYEFDKDSQRWTRRDCTTNDSGMSGGREVETLCYKETITAPPAGAERTKRAL